MTTDEDVVDWLTHYACFVADRIQTEGWKLNLVPAVVTADQIKGALAMLIGNGLITVNDPETWPEHINLDPPYTGAAPWATDSGGKA